MIPAVAAVSMAPTVKSQSPHRVVVVGGGFAGATVAKYIRMWSSGSVDVTLVEPRVKHVSCIMTGIDMPLPLIRVKPRARGKTARVRPRFALCPHNCFATR